MNKHVFITTNTDRFLNIFLANRVEDGSLTLGDIFVVKMQVDVDYACAKDISDIDGIEYITYDEVSQYDWLAFKTINFISLTSYNALLCRNLLDDYHIDTSKINILLTDDEIERWYKLFKNKGEITESPLFLVDENVLYCLKKLSNFITLREPWGNLLEKMLSRHLDISDTTLALSILPYSDQEKLYNNFGLKMRNRLASMRRKNVMVYTKPQDWKKSLSWVLSLVKVIWRINREDIYGHIYFSFWLQPFDKRFPMYLSLLLVRAISFMRKINVDIKIIYQAPPEIYFLNIFDCSFLIAQDRGGYTMIQEFMRYKGIIFVNRDSFNSAVVKNENYSMAHEYIDKMEVIRTILKLNNLEKYSLANTILPYDTKSRYFFKNMFSNS